MSNPRSRAEKMGFAPCEVCRQPSEKLCSRCKAYAVCSPECFKIGWPAHKADCKQLQESKKRIEGNPKRQSGSIPTRLLPEHLDDFMRVNEMALQIYQQYGVMEPPSKGSDMPTETKVALFVALLQNYDSGSDTNKVFLCLFGFSGTGNTITFTGTLWRT
jgi:MYND finger